MQEQFGYAYDKAWNLNYRTNNAFVENFSVNDLNELSSATPSGTLTVAGTTTEPGTDVTSVVVNTKAAVVYADGTFATNFTPNYGQRNLYKAVATDKYGRQSASIATVNVLSSAGYNYDLNGNLTNDGTRNFAYDCENELIGVWLTNAWSNSFAYDGLQRRRIEQDFIWNGNGWTETSEIHFVYDGNLVFQERDQNNQTLTTYTRGNDLSGTLQGAGGIGGLLARSDKTQIIPAILSPLNPSPQNVNTAYYHSDGNGNVTALVQASGFPVAIYQYDPFGNMISIGGLLANENKYRFSSKEWDDNAALYYFGYRFYDPKLQRWVNRDPIGNIATTLIIYQADGKAFTVKDVYSELLGKPNLYAYVANDPVSKGDLLGLWQLTIGGGMGAGGIISLGYNGGQFSVGVYAGDGIGGFFDFDKKDTGGCHNSVGFMAHAEVDTHTEPLGVDVEGQARYDLDDHAFDASLNGGYSLSGPLDISGWQWTKGIDVSSDPDTPTTYPSTFGPITGAGAGQASGVGGTACF